MQRSPARRAAARRALFAQSLTPLFVALSAAFPVGAAFAQAASPALASDLATVIVTATRTSQEADDALAAVTVVTRDEIERSQATSLPDLLRGVPGLDFSVSGGAGKLADLYVRGTNADHVLVLVDGVKIGSATSGGASYQDIPLDAIERIEIVRGPRSGLYGSEAIGGVIQIFTRRGGDGGLAPRASLGLGNRGTKETMLGLVGGVPAGSAGGWFDVGLRSFETDGFNACTTQPGQFSGCYTYEPDLDGYRNYSANARGGFRFANGVELEANALQAQGRNWYDGSFSNLDDFVQQVLGARLRAPLGSTVVLSAAVGQSADRTKNFLDSTYASRFDTVRDTASLQTDMSLDRTLLTFGVDYIHDHVDSDTQYAVTSRDDVGVFAQAQTTIGAQNLQAAIRNDDNQQFGNHQTGSLGWGTALTPTLHAYANYGTAFKAPNFNDLYYPGFSNPNLKPETARSAEFGFKGAPAFGHWTAAVFETRVTDLIALDANYVPQNTDRARIRGFESGASTRLIGFDLAASLTLLDPKNTSAGSQGKLLARRAKQSARVDIDRRLGDWSVGATVNAQSERYNDVANTTRLGGYSTLDLRADWRFARDWTLQARVANATDKPYETVYQFPAPGRTVMFTVRWQPKSL